MSETRHLSLNPLNANIGAKRNKDTPVEKVSFRSMLPTRAEAWASAGPTARGSVLGSLLGILPGTGPIIASFMSYALEKRISRAPERFGTGAVEGIAAPEASNNAAVQAAFIPTLSLGIPSNAVMAVILGAMLIHGIIPDPQILVERADMFWGLLMSFWVGNLLLLILNIPFIGLWVKILAIPGRYLYPSVLFFICIGVYSINNSVVDIGICLFFGLVGYALTLANYPMAPLLLGLVLGPMLETHFKRALLLSRGSFDVFFTSPISLVFPSGSALIVGLSLFFAWRARRAARTSPTGARNADRGEPHETSYADTAIRGALMDGETLFDLEKSLSPLNGATPVVDLRDFLDQANWRKDLQALGGMAGEFDPLPVGTRLAAPVPNPRQLIIAGANTYSHFKEARSVFDLSLQLGPR